MRALAAADFAGTRRLTRLAARRDRYTFLAWWLGLGAFVAATTAMFASSLARHEDVVAQTQMVATNVGMRLLGITSGPSVGGYMLHREFVTLAALAALMSTFAVIRHTRQNEELGRAELVGSTVVGRSAGLGCRSKERFSPARRSPRSAWCGSVLPRSPASCPPPPGARPAWPQAPWASPSCSAASET